jgi:hypothetical protein
MVPSSVMRDSLFDEEGTPPSVAVDVFDDNEPTRSTQNEANISPSLVSNMLATRFVCEVGLMAFARVDMILGDLIIVGVS